MAPRVCLRCRREIPEADREHGRQYHLWTVAPAEPTWRSLQAPTLTYAACESRLAARVRDAETDERPQNVEIGASDKGFCLPGPVDPRGSEGR